MEALIYIFKGYWAFASLIPSAYSRKVIKNKYVFLKTKTIGDGRQGWGSGDEKVSVGCFMDLQRYLSRSDF